MEERRARIEQILVRFDLAAAANRRAAGYSRGMRQRLGLACVLLPQPDFYILDEPVSALDPVGRLEVLELLASLRGKATVFFSSHVLADVERVCDHVAVLYQGRLLLQSSLESLLEQYRLPRYRISFREGPPPGLAAELRARPWARKVEASPGWIAVEAAPDGLAQMQEELLPLLAGCGAVVTSYEREHEDLEMIFLKLLREAGYGENEGGWPVKTLFVKDFRQLWRTFRLPALLLLGIFFAILDPIGAKYMPQIMEKLMSGTEGITIVMPEMGPVDAMASFFRRSRPDRCFHTHCHRHGRRGQ